MVYTHASLFSGIGGAELAASWLGWDNVFHCEIQEFQRKVLEYWFLLTPSASDGLRAGMSVESLKSHKKKNAEQSNLAEQIAHKVGGGTSQLNPLFVAEMMGYPLEWLTLPFLSQSGEVKASKR